MDIDRVSEIGSDLAESLYWDAALERLYWIDAWRTRVYAFDPATRRTDCADLTAALAGLPIGSIARDDGEGMIGGIKNGFYSLDLKERSAQLMATVETDRPSTNRLNDGKCDRAGRFWCASVNTDHCTPSAALWRFEAGRDPALMQDGLTVGNGIAFSCDDRRMYLADTFTRTVWRYDFDVGLKNVDRDLLLMSRLFGASEFRLFRHVRLPWALPSVFSGLKLTLIYCSAGAVIGEMIAAKSGLGLLVQTFSGRFDVSGVMALILIVALMVMTLTALMDLVERRLLEWSKGSTDVPG